MKYDDCVNLWKYELIILDLDGTITVKDTLVDFSLFTLRKYLLRFFIFFILVALLKSRIITNIRFKELYARYILKGLSLTHLSEEVRNWFTRRGISLIRNYFASNELITHPNKVILSSNFEFIVSKFSEYLNAKEFIATRLEVNGDECTGKLLGKVPYGKDKLNIILSKYSKNVLKERALAFGNDESDLEILKAVNKGVLIKSEI